MNYWPIYMGNSDNAQKLTKINFQQRKHSHKYKWLVCPDPYITIIIKELQTQALSSFISRYVGQCSMFIASPKVCPPPGKQLTSVKDESIKPQIQFSCKCLVQLLKEKIRVNGLTYN